MASVGGQLSTRNWCLQGSLAGWAPMRWPRDALDGSTLQSNLLVRLSFNLFLSVNFGRYSHHVIFWCCAEKKQQHEEPGCFANNGIFGRRPDSFATHFLMIELSERSGGHQRK